MAEAHSAVAFSFTITHEGLNINYDREVLDLIWKSGLQSWQRRYIRFKNNIKNGIYPASLLSLLFTITVVSALYIGQIDLSNGIIPVLEEFLPGHILGLTFGLLLFGLLLWLAIIYFLQFLLKMLFMYKGWMFEARGKGRKISTATKLWAVCVRLLSLRKPLLHSFQASLPRLPLPSLESTMDRYLISVKPLQSEEQFDRTKMLVEEFKNGIGKKLQRYLFLKSWWSTNYVTDWWEEYVYLRGRSPIMVNSNFYGVDAVLKRETKSQAARAANLTYASLILRRSIDMQTLEPIRIQSCVPLCSWQYERVFNTCRIPGVETDKLVHYDHSDHIVAMNRGKFFKVVISHKGKLLNPAELQIQINYILNDKSEPASGEEHLGALTATDRVTWANARSNYFSDGVNKTSLEAIDKAAFMLVLDDYEYNFDKADPSKLNDFGRMMLHGKGYDRWYDKSFNLIIGKNGRVGFNAEHAWADAPIMAHYWEFLLSEDFAALGYNADGLVKGMPEIEPPNPVRLSWKLPEECQSVIETSRMSAEILLNDVDLKLYMHDDYGKGFMKKQRVSPDAYIQMAFQLAYYRDSGKFSLTYEASMTRLFKEGRTETVRPVSIESCAWVSSMLDANKTNGERNKLFIDACAAHQKCYQRAMCGGGIDRHLFCLYVVSKYLEVDSPFLKEVLSEPWKLSTSQTPHGQTAALHRENLSDCISAGGGFGPVANDGYGVSYIIAGEDIVFFHISCKQSSALTDAQRFVNLLSKALQDMKTMLNAD